MCHEMEKIYSEGMESGEKRGELKKAKETALSSMFYSVRCFQIQKKIFW